MRPTGFLVRLLDLATGTCAQSDADTDLSFGSLTWEADGTGLIATAQAVLDTPAFRIDPATGTVTSARPDGRERSAYRKSEGAAQRKAAVVTRDSPSAHRAELYLSDAGGQAGVR